MGVLTGVLFLIVGGAMMIFAVYLAGRRFQGGVDATAAQREAQAIVEDARNKAELIIKEAELKAKDLIVEVRAQAEREVRDQHRELTTLESKKKFIKRYGRPGAEQGWHFLTGKKEQIDALANAVGFHYAWDPAIQQYAHASGVMLLTADGRVSKYFYGIEYAPRDLQLGLVEASQGKIGTVVDQVLLMCYHYDPATGKYGAAIFTILRITALATLLVLGGFMFIMFRRDRLQAKRAV